MTFPIAMWRVSQKEKFRGFHVKSLTIEWQNPANAVAKGWLNQLLSVAVRFRLQIISV
ncbi:MULTISPECIES: hypothetical protein [unclassified Microcoleus]|uniref:hypothetical protein n=1 Tax=unclassified Microcoleus TaxID=2642155 RepID=UPI002FD46596